MDEIQREILQKFHKELVRDILVTEELLGTCYQLELFEPCMIETIRAQNGSYQQAAKLLELLPRRGPGAFDKFLQILDSGYHWLADMLRSNIEQIKQETVPDKGTARTYLPKLEVNNDIIRSPRMQQRRDSSPHVSNPKVKETVERFISKQFTLNRKLSQTDKRAVEQFLIEQMESQPCSPIDEADCYFPSNSETPPGTHQQWLHNMHIKLKVRIDALECDEKTKEIDKKTYTLDTISTEVLEKQINFVLNQLETLDSQVSQCYNVIGEPTRRKSLSVQFEDLVVSNAEMKRQLDKEKQKIDKMSHEIYQIAMEKKKHEHNSQLKDIQLEVKENQVNKMQQENNQLKREVEKLNQLHMQHLEKQKTLHNLREMVNELQDSKKFIKEENDNLKSKLNIYEHSVTGKGLFRKISNTKTVIGKQNKNRVTTRRKIPTGCSYGN